MHQIDERTKEKAWNFVREKVRELKHLIFPGMVSKGG